MHGGHYEEPLVNCAAKGQSNYVRQQKDSPVAWQLLNEDAIARAKAEDKLIFMHIGYSACHYSHLMTNETFAFLGIARELNENFVPVIIDRDERPDLDVVYMNYVEAVHGVGGWPLNVFLTPELEPVFGGTYWPAPNNDRAADNEDRAADFHEILLMLQKLWSEQRSRLRQEAREIIGQLLAYASEGTSSEPVSTAAMAVAGIGAKDLQAKPPRAQPSTASNKAPVVATSGVGNDLDIDLMETAYTQIAGTYDAVHGGFTGTVKYVTAPKLSLLLRLPHFRPEVRDMVGYDETEMALRMAKDTLRAINRSGLHDHLGRGFSRCSVTADWSLPFFERLMVENALLLGLFTDAWLDEGGTRESEFFPVVLETADYLSSAPLLAPHGLLLSSEAADSRFSQHDSHDGPGAFFLWTRRELDTVLGPGVDSDVAAAHWNVQPRGNISPNNDPNDDFVNRNVLHIVKDVPALATQFNQPEAYIKTVLAEARTKLAEFRAKERVAPSVSSNAVAGYNGVAIAALAKAGAAVQYVEPALGKKYIQAATSLAQKLKALLWDTKTATLFRMLCEGKRSDTPAYAEDYAYIIDGLLALYAATLDESHISWAVELQNAQIEAFVDATGASRGGFFTARENTPHLLLRLKAGMDGILPSANAISAANLFSLGTMLAAPGRTDTDKKKAVEYTALAKATVEAFEAELLHFPWLFPGLLACIVPYRLGVKTVVVKDGEKAEKELKEARLAPREGPVVFVKA
ncbi:Spermatogenesis-associated protein 20 [Ceratocystis platani]|uniref:Spermatogenesis-associated protein 20 n=1 Tax=Ceratocystis fimbriata f. sp. platani TaxID=88771 RepID=A0A0F8B4Z3_CERFI|nr:Spermatogenesis-associated protein 20 [Ceratocystis platani]